LSGEKTAQPFDPADSPRELHHTQSPGKQQISLLQNNVLKTTTGIHNEVQLLAAISAVKLAWLN
jgi:hypothetical protein